jgi:heterodisulfide reductase subunit A2
VRADALVIGAGIAGLQAAIDLADRGRSVVVVEREASIGGRMINLSKVFPTLDCASCITTPRMAQAAHHPGITTLTFAEVAELSETASGFSAKVVKKPRFVREADCIGCGRCEEACPVVLPDQFEHGLGAKKAISIPFTNAIPQLPVLEMEHCTLCGACARACPKDCIDYSQGPETIELEVGAVVLASGYQLTPKEAKPQYGADRYPNVITSLQAERLLAPHGPYGKVLRPSDGKLPDSIAFVQCAGSRDASLGVPYCSRVCCMYAIKQAMLLAGSLPLAECTLYYMDIRAFGKGYEQFYQTARAMGIGFVKAKVGRIRETDNHDLLVRIERQEGASQPEEVRHDLVILSLGLKPAFDPRGLVPGILLGEDGFVATPEAPLAPTRTARPGIFAAGVATGPKDIVDTVLEASAAAVEAEGWLMAKGWCV